MKKITKELIVIAMTALLLLSYIPMTTSDNQKNAPVQEQDIEILCFGGGNWENS